MSGEQPLSESLLKYKYLVLGAGPAGLTLANRLLQLGKTDFLVLEKEKEPGGLCRSADVDESPLDIGGGHFLDVRNKRVCDFLFGFMPKDEWDLYTRDSRIEINGYEINSPIEANIWQMPPADQEAYLKSIGEAGCNTGAPMPDKFIDWIYWKLGVRIAEDYMLPYNQKMFRDDLDLLGTYWLSKLPNVSYEETLISCRDKKAYGTQPGHAQFYYPKKHGYGEVWKRMGSNLRERLICGEKVQSIDYLTKTVNGRYKTDKIISTIPWTDITEHVNMPDEIKTAVASLKHSTIVVNYRPEDAGTDAQWVYCPDPSLSYHRKLVRSNFCPGSRGYWTETNLTRFSENDHKGEYYFINEYAYPINTIGKPEEMKRILSWASSMGVEGLGRWGEWQHYNSDVVVDLALTMAESL